MLSKYFAKSCEGVQPAVAVDWVGKGIPLLASTRELPCGWLLKALLLCALLYGAINLSWGGGGLRGQQQRGDTRNVWTALRGARVSCVAITAATGTLDVQSRCDYCGRSCGLVPRGCWPGSPGRPTNDTIFVVSAADAQCVLHVTGGHHSLTFRSRITNGEAADSACSCPRRHNVLFFSPKKGGEGKGEEMRRGALKTKRKSSYME